jgi:hypothetical protein
MATVPIPASLDLETAGKLTRAGSRLAIVIAFYQDGGVETYGPPGATTREVVLPENGQEVYMPIVSTAIQTTVVLSQDAVNSPSKLMATSWYYANGAYHCRNSLTAAGDSLHF